MFFSSYLIITRQLLRAQHFLLFFKCLNQRERFPLELVISRAPRQKKHQKGEGTLSNKAFILKAQRGNCAVCCCSFCRPGAAVGHNAFSQRRLLVVFVLKTDADGQQCRGNSGNRVRDRSGTPGRPMGLTPLLLGLLWFRTTLLGAGEEQCQTPDSCVTSKPK